ncbi:MAG: TonB-dependent receptor [Methylococcaceae bacterium]|nr:TonB-dependent receptor [Methylococcaceae bacterium]
MNTALRHSRRPPTRRPSPLTWLVLAILAQAAQAVTQTRDLTGLPIEALMDVEVSSASRFPQKTTEAPASTTIITAADIQQYGYRTLADALRSVRGFFTSYDRNYEYLGVRGFGRSGDYNSRVLLLVDGYRINDPVFDTATIGTEFPLDMDLVERIEIVRGPGSSIYGSNAVYGVINVITKNGSDFGGVEATGSVANFGTDKERISAGGKRSNGLDWLVSGSRSDRKGPDVYFREFDSPATDHGIARGIDGDRYHNIFSKLNYRGFSFTGAYSDRVKEVPTAAYGTTFNDPRFRTDDTYAFANLAYEHQLGDLANLYGRLFYGHYANQGFYPINAAPLNRDRVQAESWGGELRLSGRYDRHRWVSGAELQDNFHQDLANFDVNPLRYSLRERRQNVRVGVYVQDEITVLPGLLINAGLRYDQYSTVGNALNPRIALIWSPLDSTTVKLLYGTAFRAPNAYERFYTDNVSQKPNPALRPEHITSYEMVLEHYFQPNFRMSVNGYLNQSRNQIDQIIDPTDGLAVFRNVGRLRAIGAELELERIWDNGTRLRASYAWQNSRVIDTGRLLANSPVAMAKANLSAPLDFISEKLRAGLELQYVGERKTLGGGTAHGAVLTNLTLLSERLFGSLDISLSLYNLFDVRYAHPGGSELTQDVIVQDGRDYRLKLSYRF